MIVRIFLNTFFIISLLTVPSVLGQSGSGDVNVNKEQKRINIGEKSDKSTQSNVPTPGAIKAKSIRKNRNAPPEPANSRITFDYNEFYFGNVPKNSKVVHYFKVYNTGKDTLVISRVKST